MLPFLSQLRGKRFWIAPAFFLLAVAPGSWIPVLANVLRAHGWSEFITLAFLVPPLANTLSPLLFAATADQRFPAEKVLAFTVWGCSLLLYSAFHVIERNGPPALFLFLLTLAAVSATPAWSILSAITLTHLPGDTRNFGLYRVWGTLGWIAGGWIVSALKVDQSPLTGKLAAIALVLTGAVCLMLPHTPPKPASHATWKELLGFSAFRILTHRDVAVFLGTSFLFSIPLAAFYMQTPQLLATMGHQRVAAAMTLGQSTEILALLGLGYLLRRWRIKWLLLTALASGTLRFAWLAMGAAQNSLAWVFCGIALHGFCWTFFFEAGRVFLDRRVESGMRAQVQALMTLLTSGLGSMLGTVAAGTLHRTWVVGDLLMGWRNFWMALALVCALCALVFIAGYQGISKNPERFGYLGHRPP